MKPIIINTTLLLFAACCVSCSKIDRWQSIPYWNPESYIVGYFDPERLSVLERACFETDETSMEIITDRFDVITAEENAGKYYSLQDNIFLQVDLSSRWITYDLDRERYEELRDQFGDTSFNTKIPRIGGELTNALTEKIGTFKVTVNENYSPEYTGGSDATGMFTVYYAHPYAVIRNGYSAPPGTYRKNTTFPNLPQAIYRSELSSVDFPSKTGIGNEFYLVLNSTPSQTGTYTFTIQITTSSGEVLSVDTKPIPIKID